MAIYEGKYLTSITAYLNQRVNVPITPTSLKLAVFENETFFIHSQEKIAEMRLFDINGRLLKNINSNQNSVNISNLPPGIYLLQIKTITGIFTHKIVKN